MKANIYTYKKQIQYTLFLFLLVVGFIYMMTPIENSTSIDRGLASAGGITPDRGTASDYEKSLVRSHAKYKAHLRRHFKTRYKTVYVTPDEQKTLDELERLVTGRDKEEATFDN